MKRSFFIGVLAAALLQTAALVWIVYDRVTLLQEGREIVLQTAPLDPRDLFRGDYVILSYSISTIDLQKVLGDDGFSANEPIYVALEQSAAGSWSAAGVYKEVPYPTGEQVVLKGRVSHVVSPMDTACKDRCVQLNIDYGIGKFFVPEGKGLEIERLQRTGSVSVVLAVAEDGTAAIKALLINGERRYEESLW